MSKYYKSLGMLRADMPSEEEIIELLIFNKEDIENNKIDFRWIQSKEFKYNCDMFDIVKKEERQGKLFLYCINDSKEEKLNKEFSKNVEETTANKKEKSENNNSLKTLSAEPVIYLVFKQVNTGNQRYNNYNNTVQIQTWGDVPTPPPKYFLSV
jgi:uncharacterized protein YwqG